eukprot:7389099-Prymnesium_polylepis.2
MPIEKTIHRAEQELGPDDGIHKNEGEYETCLGEGIDTGIVVRGTSANGEQHGEGHASNVQRPSGATSDGLCTSATVPLPVTIVIFVGFGSVAAKSTCTRKWRTPRGHEHSARTATSVFPSQLSTGSFPGAALTTTRCRHSIGTHPSRTSQG